MSKLTFFTAGIFLFYLARSASAQILPDRSLPNNSVLDRNGNLIKIDGGSTSGGNLFHS
jgi:large exoprotein involved in heme utilization and adhesion